MKEEALLFGTTRSLVGILADPPEAERGRNLPAVILLNAGIIHRVGPNRLYVNIARNLAAMGFVVLRFDFSGIGDSKVREDHLPFAKSAVSETQEAMNCLSAARDIHRFVLIGLCSGAVISLQTACCDPRVVGAVLINAQGLHSDKLSFYTRNRSAARYYWNSAVFNPRSWLRVIKGKTDYWNIIKTIGFQLRSLLARKTSASSGVNDAAADLHLLTRRGVSLLFLCEKWDPSLDYLQAVLGDKMHELSASGKLRVEIIQQADHTFISPGSQTHLLKVIQTWAEAMVQSPQYDASANRPLSHVHGVPVCQEMTHALMAWRPEPIQRTLIVTIDTEEEGLFQGVYRSQGNAVENTRGLERFQALCDHYGIRPTYLVDAPVVEDERSVALLRRYQNDGRCEVGAHLHPWCTPPYAEEIGRRNTFMCNLPEELQRAKLTWLTETIEKRFGRRPTSFRAGRNGLDIVGARILRELGYIVDSSVVPFTDLSAEGGPDFVDAPYTPYYVEGEDLCKPHSAGFLLEVPDSVGFSWLNFTRGRRVQTLRTRFPLRYLHPGRMLSRLGIVWRIYFTPESVTHTVWMRRLVNLYRAQGSPCLIMTLHSSSLLAGYTPYVPDAKRLERLYRNLSDTFEYCLGRRGMVSRTLTEFAQVYTGSIR